MSTRRKQEEVWVEYGGRVKSAKPKRNIKDKTQNWDKPSQYREGKQRRERS